MLVMLVGDYHLNIDGRVFRVNIGISAHAALERWRHKPPSALRGAFARIAEAESAN